MTTKKFPSLMLILLAYVVAMAAAVLTVRLLEESFSAFTAGLIADVVATVVIFVFSMVYSNSSAYDPYWSVAPPVLFLYWASRTGTMGDNRSLLLLGVTLVWALRLTSNWMRDWPGLGHEDWRYVEFRRQHGKAYPAVSFGGIHMFPTGIVILGSIPAWAVLKSGGDVINIFDIIGGALSLGGAILCYVADEQMRRHRRSGKGGVMVYGLWSVTRHPNYLGEIMFWFGLWFIALGASSSYWWTGIGAVAMYLLFRLKSGPWMEEKIARTRPEYTEAVKDIPMLIPVPGRRIGKAEAAAD